MPITVLCPSCKARLKAPDAAAGRTFACPGCKTNLTIPLIVPASPPPKPAPRPPAPPVARPAPVEEFDDFEVVDEAEEVEEAEVLEEIEELEEVGPNRKKSKLKWSKVLKLRQIHVRGKGEGAAVLDPERDKRMAAASLIRPARKKGVSRVEVHEGRDDELLLTVGGPFKADESGKKCMHIFGPDDRILGAYPPVTWADLKKKPIWIIDELGRKVLEVLPDPQAGRCALLTPEGIEVGQVVTEAAYEGRGKAGWFVPGDDCYVAFKKEMENRLEDKLLFLGLVIGLDVLEEDEEDEDD